MTKKWKNHVAVMKGKPQHEQVAYLNDLAAHGWELVSVSDGNAYLKMPEPAAVEYQVVEVPMHPRRGGGEVQEVMDALAADGWRLAANLQGPGVRMGAALVFERDA